MAGNTGPFDLGKMAFGSLGQMFDGIDSVKRAWSMFNAPSALIPTLDVEELDKRIADLKAVEQWLNLNVNMLRGTIQGLEIQRGTLAAVKAFGASFSGAASSVPSSGSSSMAASAPSAGSSPWPSWAAPTPNAAAAPARGSVPPEPSQAPPQPSANAPRNRRATRSAKPAAGAPPVAPGAGLPGIDASAWWNLLQGTFNQVAQAALSGAGLPGGSTGATPAAGAGSARKPASSSQTRGAGTAAKARPRARR